MKNFNLFLAFVVCSSVVIATAEVTAPVATTTEVTASAAEVTAPVATTTEVTAPAVEVTAPAATTTTEVTAPAVEVTAPAATTTTEVAAPAASKFDTFKNGVKYPFTQANKALTYLNEKVLAFEKEAASNVSANTPAVPAVVSTTTSTVVEFIAKNQVSLVLAAVATYGVYAYVTSNSSDEESKN